MTNPLVSIVIPTHNRLDYLPLTLDSVFAQSYEPVEIIVIDDGSTDGTQKWLSSLGSRIRLLTQASQGVAIARNAAVREARGEFIAFQDDDDLMASERIRILMMELEAFPDAVMATGDYALIDHKGVPTGRRWLPAPKGGRVCSNPLRDGHEAILWPRIPAVPHTTLFRKADGEKVGWFDPSFRYACSDADFLARLGRLGPVVHIPEVVSYYRRGHRAIWSGELKANYSRLQLWLKHLPERPDNPALQERLRERMFGALKAISRGEAKGEFVASADDLLCYREEAIRAIGTRRALQLAYFQRVSLPARRALRLTTGW
jgi:glycosyltransferase involved in cell wall biosynthesis